MLQKISKIISGQSKLQGFKKPLEAAEVCDAAREISEGQYTIISFHNGLLTVGVSSSYEAAERRIEADKIINKINQKIGRKAVKKIRFKIT